MIGFFNSLLDLTGNQKIIIKKLSVHWTALCSQFLLMTI